VKQFNHSETMTQCDLFVNCPNRFGAIRTDMPEGVSIEITPEAA